LGGDRRRASPGVFAAINPIAPVFAGFFILQAVLFLRSAAPAGDLQLHLGQDFRSMAGLAAPVCALAIYPVPGIWSGHGLTDGPMFGVAPCPTTILTNGMLPISRGRWADLVLLDADPSENLAALRRPQVVIVGGRFLDRAALNDMDIELLVTKE
jgi:hypothetical protein